MDATASFAARAAAVRRFNRLYTKIIGLLEPGLCGSRFSLTEGRLLYELAARGETTASDIGRDLALDAGYLSRLLQGFEREGLIERHQAANDRRKSVLSLTESGRQAFAPVDQGSQRAVEALIGRLPEPAQETLVASMGQIETLLGTAKAPPLVLRSHRAGDIGWIIERHGAVYGSEYGFGPPFEALVAEVGAGFLRSYDERHERCWIAEQSGVRAGSVMLVRETEDVARLRLLLVEPWARGAGLGEALVNACIAFARQVGYRQIVLWTHSILTAARRIYQRTGFRLVRTEPHRHFGPELLGEDWVLDLHPNP
jgi:DNA-binding MarR family transcriptional regulator/GNAT superfamily N-acetyltransferase